MGNTVWPWVWTHLPLDGRSGSEIFASLFLDDGIATLLESPQNSTLSHSRYSLCAGRPRQRDGDWQIWTPPVGEVFPCLQSLSDRPLSSSLASERSLEPPPHLPFWGGWLGWLGYGVSWEIETLPRINPDPLPFPDAYWYEPAQFAILDHWTDQLWLAAANLSELQQLKMRLQQDPGPEITSRRSGKSSAIEWITSQKEYEAMVQRAQRYIARGDIFQANLSLRFQSKSQLDPWDLYRNLQTLNPSPFASFWKTPWGGLISCSPERLVDLRGRQAQTRPIAGTRPRGESAVQNQRWQQDLIQNQKERAEHIMLVDLERNDLGRVCAWGSVQVNELLAIESYSHVMHLVSNVTGQLRPQCSPIDLIRALFPGGTITGCPKVRCMEIIEELEPVHRSLFYGSCGYLDIRGQLDLNILIRTLLYSLPNSLNPAHGSDLQERTIWGQVGAGIVADSHPEREWHESIQKAQAQLAALG